MPAKIYGYVQKYQEIYLIYINEQLNTGSRFRTLIHELNHIVENDFDREGAAEITEYGGCVKGP
jgi:Zn-dependent peptidase ImmA (M78 family)